jgi:hypothetical protein
MTFKDYTSRIWLVTESDLPECPKDKHVDIQGSESDVIVKCDEIERYKRGMYVDKGDNGEIIGKENDYRISVVAKEPKYEITFEKLGSIAGSWTAEDHTPG